MNLAQPNASKRQPDFAGKRYGGVLLPPLVEFVKLATGWRQGTENCFL